MTMADSSGKENVKIATNATAALVFPSGTSPRKKKQGRARRSRLRTPSSKLGHVSFDKLAATERQRANAQWEAAMQAGPVDKRAAEVNPTWLQKIREAEAMGQQRWAHLSAEFQPGASNSTKQRRVPTEEIVERMTKRISDAERDRDEARRELDEAHKTISILRQGLKKLLAQT